MLEFGLMEKINIEKTEVKPVDYIAINYIVLSKEELKMYEEEKKARLDNAAAEAYIHSVGKAEGEKLGADIAMLLGAKRLKVQGDTVDKTASVTGLSIKEIERLYEYTIKIS